MTVHIITLAAAYVIAALALARLARLVTQDSWPPIAKARDTWITWCAQTPRRSPWSDLAECPFCAAPWLAIPVVAVGIAGDVWSPDLGSLSGWWWILAVWASLSYLAAMIVVRDEG